MRSASSSSRVASRDRGYSAAADLQDDWEIHGKAALAECREKFVDRYVENYAIFAHIIRVEADVKHSPAKPKTVNEALAELESKVGKEGRRKFEKFLRAVAEDEDEDEDVIDVTTASPPLIRRLPQWFFKFDVGCARDRRCSNCSSQARRFSRGESCRVTP